jgi:prepilin-type N-terminal cleavage/methylation domain-containing protein
MEISAEMNTGDTCMTCPTNETRNSAFASCHRATRGFTLLEILVVISIIALLVGISAMVGTAVIDSGRKKSTQGIIQSLDQALAAYIDQKGDIPPALVEVPFADLPESIKNEMPGDVSAFYPAVDGQGMENLADDIKMINSVALFIQSVSVAPATQEIINSINPKYVQNFSADEDVQPFLLTVFDAWGNPIRYVHPKFDGIIERERRSLADAGEPVNLVNPNKPFFVAGALPENSVQRVRMKFVRRNRLVDADFGDAGLSGGGGINPSALSDYDLIPDSDGGLTIGNKPYFYSAGPDGNPATIEDNIYTITPQHVDPGVN